MSTNQTTETTAPVVKLQRSKKNDSITHVLVDGEYAGAVHRKQVPTARIGQAYWWDAKRYARTVGSYFDTRRDAVAAIVADYEATR